jgi:ATP-dependent exoDNAse (exonuclease V) alpha subunit
MTVHKAQGRTIDKVVLDLHYKSNHRKWLGFDGIFVSLENITKSKTNSGAITMLLTD